MLPISTGWSRVKVPDTERDSGGMALELLPPLRELDFGRPIVELEDLCCSVATGMSSGEGTDTPFQVLLKG